MKARKVAVVAGFATGAAIAFAPLASALPTDLIDFDSINNSEIASLNSLFSLGGTLTGVPDSAFTDAGPGQLLGLTEAGLAQYAPPDPATAADVTAFEYYLYGVNPIEAGISSGSSAANVFNGAAIQFADAYNATLFQTFNPNEVLPADIFIGKPDTVLEALATDNPAVFFYNFAIGDLSGYFQQDLSFLQIPVAEATAGAADPVDLSSTFTAEIDGLNSLFGSFADLAGVSDKIMDGVGPFPFDTIATGDTTELFNTLLLGLNPDNVTDGTIGSYDVLNGALTEFANAYNVGLFALLSGGDLIDSGDIFGLHADFLEGGVSSAVTDFLTLGFNDLLGYFDPGSLIPTM